MNIAEWSIRRSVISWVLTVLLVVVGWLCFTKLSRLEDPEFTIKEATITTPYPGASAAEVEEEVTNVIEKACQQLGQLDRVESRSSRDLSIVKAIIKDKYDKKTLPQVWDELRRKVNDAQKNLPPGAGPSTVNDDFGDVYGVFYAITGEGYTYRQIYDYAKLLERELLKATDVKKIVLYGVQPEAIYVEMKREKMAALGISPLEIFRALGGKNIAVNAGYMSWGPERIAVNPTGEFQSEKEFGELLIRGRGESSDRLVLLRDVAEILRGYSQPPRTLLRFNGKPAIGLGISTVLGGNVITMGESLNQRLAELESLRPMGMELNPISMQPDAVNLSIQGFLVNLVEAVAIVVVVLLIFMGLRSGIIIGIILLVTIMGTFIFMQTGAITLERISLGALVIALGMLVDNAIVVTDGMRLRMQQGEKALEAAIAVVSQVGTPLLGATVVAVAAFASIGTSQDSTGEYCRSLFYVILISLMLSWVTAVTSTPLLCKSMLKQGQASSGGESADPYQGKMYRAYRKFLYVCIRVRWITLGVVVVLFVAAIIGFQSVKKSFFPDSTRPQFFVDFWFDEGTDIRQTAKQLESAEVALRKYEGVTNLTTSAGGGQVRFLLTYSPEYLNASYGQILVDVDDYRKIGALTEQVQSDLEALMPQAVVNVRKFVLGPSTGGKIQLRLYGPDEAVLREMALRAETIMRSCPDGKAVRNEWGSTVKVVRPQMAETPARRAGLERPDIANIMAFLSEGLSVGIYRERDELLPIVARAPESERKDVDNFSSLPIWSPAAQKMIPLGQVVTEFLVAFENPHIWRRDRMRMLRLHADPRVGLPSEFFNQIKLPVEKALNVDFEAVQGMSLSGGADEPVNLAVCEGDRWPLKEMPGYSMAWGGEVEDSAKANAKLMKTIPIFFGLMVLIILGLFNSIQKTLIIWLCVPLAIIGVTAGLLLFHQPFGFMSLLGLLSLSGMLIKNAIVLIDEIGVQISQGKEPHEAVLDSGVSRLIPVLMAASTTILGMAPLVQDAFFVSMAVTIMFGLGFATVLTLVIVPVFYTVFYRIPSKPAGQKVAAK